MARVVLVDIGYVIESTSLLDKYNKITNWPFISGRV